VIKAGLLRHVALGARIEPDVVLLGWYWNDVSERAIQPTYEAFLPRGEFAFDTGGSSKAWRACAGTRCRSRVAAR
jgi:hypothetical protein